MLSILCYGDSNTWGWEPETGGRFGREVRWPGVMRVLLGDEYEVVEEGLSGRTTVWDHPIQPDRNGRTQMVPILESHVPLHLIIVLLGTNDVNPRFAHSAAEVAQGAGQLVVIARRYASHVLLVAPPPYAEIQGSHGEMNAAIAMSGGFADAYQRIAEHQGCHFLDAGSVIESSPIDGSHWSAHAHRALGERMAQEVRSILSTELRA